MSPTNVIHFFPVAGITRWCTWATRGGACGAGRHRSNRRSSWITGSETKRVTTALRVAAASHSPSGVTIVATADSSSAPSESELRVCSSSLQPYMTSRLSSSCRCSRFETAIARLSITKPTRVCEACFNIIRANEASEDMVARVAYL